MRSRSALFVVAIALSLAACGGGDRQAGQATGKGPEGGSAATAAAQPAWKPPDPCTVLTKDEASAALGAAVTRVHPNQSDERLSACFYGQEDSFSEVSVMVRNYPMERDAFVAETSNYSGETCTPVTGLGDAACYIGDLTHLYVHKGQVVMILSSPGQRKGATQPNAALRKLATQALAKLP